MGYQLKIILKSPVCIARYKGVGNVIETIDYIPGNTIRGALAMYYLKTHGTWHQEKRLYILPDTEKVKFDNIFNSEAICFNNAYIGDNKVIPLTASTCKYKSGFEGENGDDSHGVRDTLMELVKYELTGNFNQDIFDVCEKCQAPMDRFSGYYEVQSTPYTMYKQETVEKRFIARSTLNDTFETASSGKLYTIEVIEERQGFKAELNKETFGELQPLFDEKVVRIGRAKSRGFGEVHICVEKTVEDKSNSLKSRFEGFNNEMRKSMQNKYFFSVTLLSDMILLDEILRFKSTVEISDLVNSTKEITPECEASLNKFKLLRGFLTTRIVSEWNHALKLPQEDSLAIAKGSVFVFVSDELTENAIEHLITILDVIEKSGFGEQQKKGYGRIKFCDEFHWKDELK